METSVLARNMQPGPTVFSLDAGNNGVIEWKGAGDLMGEDLQPVPAAYLDHVWFQRAVSRGIIVIENAPEEISRVMDLHKQEWTDRQAAAQAASQAVLDQAPQNDLLMLRCVGPNCDTQVSVRQRARNDAPPLCGLHKSLAPRYVSEVTDKMIDGKPEVRWQMIQVDQSTRQN